MVKNGVIPGLLPLKNDRAVGPRVAATLAPLAPGAAFLHRPGAGFSAPWSFPSVGGTRAPDLPLTATGFHPHPWDGHVGFSISLGPG